MKRRTDGRDAGRGSSRNAAGVRNPRFILLTSDKRGLERTIGRDAVNELIFARPYDPAEVLRAVRFVVEDGTLR